MATWLAHLRIAEQLLAERELARFPAADFLAGSVAPDCGAPVPGGFDPPKEVTHWTKSGKGHCEYERFAAEMLHGQEHDLRTRAFLTAYFCHLMADVLWVKLINEPCKARNHELYTTDREEYYRRVKPEWYANDHLFLHRHPDCRCFREFCRIDSYPVDCLPYYSRDNVENQIHVIQQFYLQPPEYSTSFSFLTPREMDEWVREASRIIAERLGKGF